jgi:cytochrome c oxidase assembly protein subunit 15
MMRAPANADPSKLKRDITRLLRASGGWDQAGRQALINDPLASAGAPASAPRRPPRGPEHPAMDAAHALIDWTPLLRLLGLAAVIALLPLSWWWLRQRGAPLPRKLAALTALILFLTIDLIVVGAFTRLTDSGLGCPDWPGCYGDADPLGRQGRDQRRPGRPAHRAGHPRQGLDRDGAPLPGNGGGRADPGGRLAMSWRARAQLPHSPWWATATLLWVLVQGAFGKYTVTLKLYPADRHAAPAGGIVLLALLAAAA